MYDGKDYEIEFHEDGQIDTELKNYIIPISTITNNLKVIDYSQNIITFHSDGSIDESSIKVSDNNGNKTYTFNINCLGSINEKIEEEEEIESPP